MKCTFKPYEGPEKYIFVSYSHRDGKTIAGILEALNEKGFRIWYDEGIEWGTEWPESIAKHLHGCAVVMAFHSKTSIVSRNCRQEINYALKCEKDILSVYLEEVELSKGLDMQLTSYQSTYSYQYASQEEFCLRLIGEPLLQDCRSARAIKQPDDASRQMNVSGQSLNGNDTSPQADSRDRFAQVSIEQIREPVVATESAAALPPPAPVPKPESDKATYVSAVLLDAAFSPQPQPDEQEPNLQSVAKAQPDTTQDMKIVDGVLVKYRGPGGDVVIPEGVTTIRYWAFNGCASLTSVTIPDGVTRIEDSTFQKCASLTSVTIPRSVTEIGRYAFYECANLTSVAIPDGVTRIEDSAFQKCASLTSVTIPKSVTGIGRYAFYECASLTSVAIPEGVTKISDATFFKCASLTSVTIPEGVTTIGKGAFLECNSLVSVIIPESVTMLDKWAFMSCKSLKNISIPASVSQIGENVFHLCRNLTIYTSARSYAHEYAKKHNIPVILI